MTTELYGYQKRGVNFIAKHGGRVLQGDEMGLGKSAQAIKYWEWLDKWPVVVVCPKQVKTHWRREWLQHAGVRAEELESTSPPSVREFRAAPRRKVYVVNYDVLGPWMRVLRSLSPAGVVIDECHYCQSRGTGRTKQVRRLCKGVGRVIAMSGTPLTNRPAELWPVLNVLWPDEFPSFFGFATRYCAPRRRPWGWEYKGASRLPELRDRITSLGFIRRRKEDVLKDLPPKVRLVVPVPLSDPDEYAEAEEGFLRWLSKNFGKRRATSAAAAERLVKVGYMLRLTAKLKRDAVERWHRRFLESSPGKLISFGFHRFMVRHLQERFPGSVLVDGQVTGRHRTRAVDRFTRKGSCRMLFGNLIAAGTGWNGTAANDVAMTELYWKPGVHSQAEDRPHRVGQTGEVRVHYLFARGTVEEDLAKLLKKKQDVLDQVLDGRQVLESLNLLDLWAKKLLERRGAR